MKNELIQTENYLLIVDDSEIKVGDWCIMFDSVGNVFSNPQQYTNPETQHLNKGLKKITAHLPLNGAPVLEGVDLLPKLEEKYDFAEMFYGTLKATYPDFDEWVEAKEYNKAKDKYKYTEENLYRMFLSGNNLTYKIDPNNEKSFQESFNVFKQNVQSLQQPKMPVGFECDYEPIIPYQFTAEDHLEVKPKTTTNSQGQTVWVGKYIY